MTWEARRASEPEPDPPGRGVAADGHQPRVIGWKTWETLLPSTDVILDRQKLAALDEARDYDAASSYNFLNAELARLHDAVASGAVVRLEDEAGRFVLTSVAELTAWARGRYPFASYA